MLNENKSIIFMFSKSYDVFRVIYLIEWCGLEYVFVDADI